MTSLSIACEGVARVYFSTINHEAKLGQPCSPGALERSFIGELKPCPVNLTRSPGKPKIGICEDDLGSLGNHKTATRTSTLHDLLRYQASSRSNRRSIPWRPTAANRLPFFLEDQRRYSTRLSIIVDTVGVISLEDFQTAIQPLRHPVAMVLPLAATAKVVIDFSWNDRVSGSRPSGPFLSNGHMTRSLMPLVNNRLPRSTQLSCRGLYANPDICASC